MFEHRILSNLRLVVLCLVMSAAMLAHGQDQTPVFEITPEHSTVKFNVKASVALVGTFEKWDSTLAFTSTDVSTGVMDIKIQADSVSTGSGMKDGKLKGKDFFDVKQNPLITFHSDKIVQTGPNTFDLPGTFTIRGVSKPETLKFIVAGTRGSGSGDVQGTMAFDRRDYGMNKGIPFVTIADRVEVTVDLKAKRVSGPPLAFKQ
ncbi:MAG TPA: YceI family protein [Terriglobales bacterium]|jgi:polyisoprenoid-binding protein YceI|nr:YceI family protein [Terriglobales bacterium]